MDKFANLPYSRPDFDAFRRLIEEQTQAIKNATCYAELRDAYIKVEEENAAFSSLENIAYIRNTIDTTDEFYDKEMQFYYENMPTLGPLMQAYNMAIIASPYLADFTAEMGEQKIRDMKAGIRLISEENIPLQIEEAKLISEYSKAVAQCGCIFRGEECNLYGLLKHMESTDRAERKEAFEAWAAQYEGVSATLDDIYSRLVANRVQQAKTLGFDSFIDMVYLSRGRYDYNADDVARFREGVRQVITPAVDALFRKQAQRIGVDTLHSYDESLVFPEGNATPKGTPEELVAVAHRMYSEMSPETKEFFDFMVKYEMFDLVSKPGKHLGGYCTILEKEKAPFIFSNFNGTSADIDVLTHEAGHAFEAYTASRHLPVGSNMFATSEIAEIHSMTMEYFAYPWIKYFVGEEENDKYIFAHLFGSIATIPYLVSVDEFQHEVFARPTMTAEERRAVWKAIEGKYMPWRDYDGNEFLSQGGFWMQKQHIFMYPFYYVDYALAQTCACSFYTKMQKDRNAAWNGYYALCKLGGSKGYFETLAGASLPNPFDEGTVEAIYRPIVDELLKREAALSK